MPATPLPALGPRLSPPPLHSVPGSAVVSALGVLLRQLHRVTHKPGPRACGRPAAQPLTSLTRRLPSREPRSSQPPGKKPASFTDLWAGPDTPTSSHRGGTKRKSSETDTGSFPRGEPAARGLGRQAELLPGSGGPGAPAGGGWGPRILLRSRPATPGPRHIGDGCVRLRSHSRAPQSETRALPRARLAAGSAGRAGQASWPGRWSGVPCGPEGRGPGFAPWIRGS